MNLYVKNNNFHFELENLTRLFFPDEKINVYREEQKPVTPYILAELADRVTVKAEINGFVSELSAPLGSDDNSNELITVQLLYKMLCLYS